MTNIREWTRDEIKHITKHRQQYEQAKDNSEGVRWPDFVSLLMGGESRNRPGVAVDYVLVVNQDNEEVFYSEWPAADDDDQIEINLNAAYDAYTAGEAEYIL